MAEGVVVETVQNNVRGWWLAFEFTISRSEGALSISMCMVKAEYDAGTVVPAVAESRCG
jgi:hypothetical protein